MAEAIIRDQLKILGTLGSGAGNPILTRDPVTKLVKEVPPIDPSTYLSTTLPQGYLLVGNASNIATAVPLSGAISITPAGLTSLANDSITNVHINSGAAIAYSKLNLTGAVVNNDIAAAAGITRSKLASGNTNRVLINNASGVMAENAALTINRVLVSDGDGLPVASAMTAANLLFLDTGATSLTTLLSNKLEFSSGITPANGDIVYFNTAWTNLGIGTAGQVLTVSGGGLPVWGAAAANGLPTGGSAGQYLRKSSGTNYDAAFAAILTTEISGVTASSADLNILSGASAAGVTAAELLYINGVTSNIQSQIDLKLDRTLTQNYMFVGNVSNVATPLATGANGYVLTSVGGVPTWVAPGAGGTVTSVQVSGGTTGLSATGGPITTSGTITLSGILIAANGGTGFGSYTVGDILYADTTTTLAKLIAGTSGYVLTSNGAGVAPTWQALPSSGHIIENAGTPLAAQPDLNFLNGLTASNNVPNTATDVQLGGTLTAIVTITTSAFDMRIGNTAGAYFNASSGTVGLITNFAQLVATSGDVAGAFTFTDSRTTKEGIVYAADYSAGYTARSLVDKGYVQSLTGTTGAWRLSDGGTLTGNNTITINTASNLSFIGTWTATANNDYMARFGGTLTARTTASDILHGYLFNPSMTGGATNTQYLYGVTVSPTLTGGADNGDNAAGLTVQPTFSGTFAVAAGIFSVATLAGTYRALRVQNFGAGNTRIGFVAQNGSGLATADEAYIERANGVNSNFTVLNTGTGSIVMAPNGSTALTIKSGATPISQESYGLLLNTQGILSIATSSMQMYYSSTTAGNLQVGSSSAGVLISTGALSSSWKPALYVAPGAHTSMTANTEFVSNDFQGASQQWLAGTVTTQRFNYFRGFTVTGASATAIFSQAYTVYIDAPVIGANANIGANFALGTNGNIQVGSTGTGFVYAGSIGTSVNNSLSFYTGGALAGAITSPLGNWNLTSGAPGDQAKLLVQAPAQAGATPRAAFRSDGAAHTNITAAAEAITNDFRGASQQWAAGTVATQRFNYFRGFTVTGVAATATFTDAYNVYVERTTASTNAAITRNWAIGADGSINVTANGGVAIGGTTDFTIVGLSTTLAGHFFVGGVSNASINIGTSTSRWSMISGVSGTGVEMRAATTSARFGFGTGFGGFYLTQSALSSSWQKALEVTPGAHTSMTASTEFVSTDFAAASQQWLAGTVATQRFNYFRGYTVTGASATAAFTDLINVAIENPVVGTNASATNVYALMLGTSTQQTSMSMYSAGGGALSGLYFINSSKARGAGVLFRASTGELQYWGGAGAGLFHTWYNNNAEKMRLSTLDNLLIGSTTDNARLYTVQGALASSWVPVERSDPGAHTSMTAATEFISRDYQGASQQWLAGTVAHQRFNLFRGYTLTGATATATFTQVSTVAIEEPIVSTNASITRANALHVTGGVTFQTTTNYGGTDFRVVSSSGASWFNLSNNRIIYLDTNGGNSRITPDGSLGLTIQNNRTTITQNALSSAWQKAFTINPGAHTALTASTEFISNDFVGASQQWNAGTVGSQKFNYFRGFTVTGASATATFTNIYTVWIDPPVASTNATFTNPAWALGVGGGFTQTSSGSGQWLLNGNWTASANGSTRFKYEGTYTVSSGQFHNFIYNSVFPTINTAANDQEIYLYSHSGTFALGANTGAYLVGWDYNMSVTGTPAQHMAMRVRNGSVLIGDQAYMTAGDILLELNHASKAFVLTRFAGDVASPVNGMMHYNNTTNKFRFRQNGAWVELGGGGITNGAAANEMMKSDGTNAVASGLFSTVAGDLTLGTSLTGAARTITATGSATDVGLVLASKGSGTLATPALIDLGTSAIAGDRSIIARSSDTNSSVEIHSKGTGSIRFVTDTAYIGNNSLAGASRTFSVLGSAADVGLVISSKGTGAVSLTASTVGFYVNSNGNFAFDNGSFTDYLIINTHTISSAGSAADVNITFDPKGAGFVDVASGASLRILGGTQSTTYSDATTNTVINLLQLTRQTSGTPAVGMGVGLLFSTQSFNGNVIESVSTDLTGASEDFDLIIKNMAGGAVAAEKLRIKSTGQLQLAGYTASGSFTGTPVGYLQFDASGNIITAAVPSGGGNVSNTGTPADNQIAVWTTSTVIEGTANLTFDGTTFTVNGGTIVGSATTQNIFNTAATTVNIAGAATTFVEGGTPTGAITATYFGNATAAATKTINIGTGSGATSTTAINIGTGSTGTAVNVTIGTSTLGTTQINGGTTSIASTTVTMSAATAVNVNGASPSFVSTSTGTLTFFNTNLLTVTQFGAATTFTMGGTPTGAITANFFNNATSGATKTINIGTSGGATSTVAINIGTGSTGTAVNVTIGTGTIGTTQINGATTSIASTTVTMSAATTVNVNGASPSFVSTSTGTLTFFNTNLLTVTAFGAATTATFGGTPTGTLTANFFTNATATATTKTINIGTAGAAGSTTNVNIGSAVASAVLGTLSLNFPTILTANNNTTVALWNTNSTVINFAGAATTLTIGATTGTMNLRNATIVLTQTPATDAGFSTSNLLARDSSGNIDVIAASGGGTTNFLRADGTWAAPPNPIGIQDMWIPATAMYPKTTGGSGAATQIELATSLVNLQCLQLTSTTADENVQFVVAMPRNWNNGTITFRVHWTATSGTGVVRWALRAAAYSNDDLMTTSNWGTAVAVDDTLTVANDLHVADRSAAVTVGGTPADEDLVVFELTRVGSNAADTFTGTAMLIGISLAVTTDAATAA